MKQNIEYLKHVGMQYLPGTFQVGMYSDSAVQAMQRVRQGDVYLKKTTMYEDNPKKLDTLVIAAGEKTGHNHVAVGEDVALYLGGNGRMYLRVGAGGARVEHQEHAAVTLAPGTYEAVVQKEFDELEGVRQVSD